MDFLFKIYTFESEEALRVSQNINEPHVHDFEEIIIGIEGRLTHFIDFKDQPLLSPFITYVSKGKLHRAQPELIDNKCFFWVIRFVPEFVPNIIFGLYNQFHEQAGIQLPANYNIDKLNFLCRLLHDEYTSERSNLSIIRSALLTILTIIEVERVTYTDNEDDVMYSTQSLTFKNFLILLEENYKEQHNMDFYADKLFMSSRNLNNICQLIMHQTATSLIENRRMLEAKHLLSSTENTVAEIAFELGYKENAHFNSVFKKKTGFTPLEFRKKIKTIIS